MLSGFILNSASSVGPAGATRVLNHGASCWAPALPSVSLSASRCCGLLVQFSSLTCAVCLHTRLKDEVSTLAGGGGDLPVRPRVWVQVLRRRRLRRPERQEEDAGRCSPSQNPITSKPAGPDPFDAAAATFIWSSAHFVPHNFGRICGHKS